MLPFWDVVRDEGATERPRWHADAARV